jgi:hypothetical protein
MNIEHADAIYRFAQDQYDRAAVELERARGLLKQAIGESDVSELSLSQLDHDMNELQITVPRRHYADLVAITECYATDPRLKLDADQLAEVQGYLAEAHDIAPPVVQATWTKERYLAECAARAARLQTDPSGSRAQWENKGVSRWK